MRYSSHPLRQLACLYGVQTAYQDVTHCRRQASVEALLAVLRSLGAPIATLQDALPAWRERQQELWRRVLEPVVVAWDGEPFAIEVRLPANKAGAPLTGHLTLETGERQSWEWRGTDPQVLETAEVEGIPYVVRQIPLPGGLPWGYHRLTLEMAGGREEALIISAPLRAYVPPERRENRMWGVFLPLYALHTDRSWGGGDFSDLEALMTWVAGMGGQVVATLPLLATFLDDFYEPSPYLPVSRLLWNEFYLDINRVPELPGCPEAQAFTESPAFQQEIEALRHSSLVDYHRQMALKRGVLEKLCHCLFAGKSQRLESLQRFVENNPIVADYARFRAAHEKYGSWRSWPQPLRDGSLQEIDYREEDRRYHLYVQWLVQQQMEDISKRARKRGLQLYLDLPVGVHPEGYDVWREHDAFILDASAGAPPDIVFPQGQNWEFPPLHPEKIREQGYRYVVAYLRHHLRYAGILRIDHVMGLHRLFCIPKGLEASRGVYVRYHAEELYAILSLESHRNKASVVGEDLGTVPLYVRPAMRRHGLHRMYVVHYELADNTQEGLLSVPRASVSSLNTHDMPPFAAFWQDRDIEQRREVGLLTRAGAQGERKDRRAVREALLAFLRDKGWLEKPTADAHTALKACLAFLSARRTYLTIVNLEDLWLEIQPQNVPSTKGEYPNWRRKARYGLEEFCQMPPVLDTLQTVNRLRQRRK